MTAPSLRDLLSKTLRSSEVDLAMSAIPDGWVLVNVEDVANQQRAIEKAIRTLTERRASCLVRAERRYSRRTAAYEAARRSTVPVDTMTLALRVVDADRLVRRLANTA